MKWWLLLWVGMACLYMGCSNPNPDQSNAKTVVQNGFPDRFTFPNPYGVEDLPWSVYVTNSAGLTEAEKSELPGPYLPFLEDFAGHLDQVASKMNLPHLKEWTLAQKEWQVLVGMHNYGPILTGTHPKQMVQLTNQPSLAKWKTGWKGPTLDLEACDEVPDSLPQALKELYS